MSNITIAVLHKAMDIFTLFFNKTTDEGLKQFLKRSHNGLVQDCGISSANALEILQSCSKLNTINSACIWQPYFLRGHESFVKYFTNSQLTQAWGQGLRAFWIWGFWGYFAHPPHWKQETGRSVKQTDDMRSSNEWHENEITIMDTLW